MSEERQTDDHARCGEPDETPAREAPRCTRPSGCVVLSERMEMEVGVLEARAPGCSMVPLRSSSVHPALVDVEPEAQLPVDFEDARSSPDTRRTRA